MRTTKRYAEQTKNVKKRMNSKIFRSIFKSILVIVPIPIVIIIVAELASLFMMEKMADEFEKTTIDRVLNQIDQDFQQAYQVLNRMKRDTLITQYVRKTERDYYDEYLVYDQLRKIVSGYDNIDEIYLYFPGYEYVLSSSSGGRESEYFLLEQYKETYEEWNEKLNSSWQGKFQTIIGAAGDVKSIVTGGIENSGGEYTVKAVVQLKNDYLLDILGGLSLRGGEEAFVYSSNGMVISTMENQNEEELFEKLWECQNRGGTNIQMDDMSYSLNFVKSGKTGLTLVYATPKGASYSVLAFTKIFAVVVAVAGTLLLIFMAFFVADRNYTPIQYLLNTVKDTDKEWTEEQDIRDLSDLEVYMKKSIHSREEMNRKLKQYEEDMKLLHLGRILFQGARVTQTEEVLKQWGFKGRYYAVLMCVFEAAEAEEEEEIIDSPAEEITRKDILSEYIKEYFPQLCCFYLMEGKDGFFGIVNGDGVSQEQFRQSLGDQRDKMKKGLADMEGLFCTIFISQGYEDLGDSHKAYEEVKGKQVKLEIQEKIEENECSIERIVEIIKNNLSDVNLSVNGIAEQMEITPSHLSRYFKNKMGMGVLEYIHQCRVEMAKDMLKNSKETRIREVASLTGFYNITTFIRVFKKVEGMTPGQYRELLDKKEE